MRKVATAETMPNSPIIIPESSREKLASCQMLIVAVGAPEACELGPDCDRPLHEVERPNGSYEVHPVDERIKPNAWILISPRSLTETADSDVFLVRQSDIQGVFIDTEDAILK